jgi:Centromere DNA-binding protein complex CBF3 subunit, domain 2
MRTIASFREEGSGFYLPRAKVDPPEALQRQIWPKIDG